MKLDTPKKIGLKSRNLESLIVNSCSGTEKPPVISGTNLGIKRKAPVAMPDKSNMDKDSKLLVSCQASFGFFSRKCEKTGRKAAEIAPKRTKNKKSGMRNAAL